MNLSEQEQYFLKYYYKLINEILCARAHLNLWECLEKYKSTSYVAEFNNAEYFFTFTQKAHLDDVILTLSRIVDTHENSLTLWKFLNYAEQKREIFSMKAFKERMKNEPDYEIYWKNKVKDHKPLAITEIEEDRQKLKKLSQIVNNISTWRDKVLAHIDRQYLLSGRNFTKEFPLRLQQLQEIIKTLFNILSRYSGAFNSSEYDEEISGENDIQFVMDCIRFYNEECNRQMKAKLELVKNNRLR